VGGLNSLSLLIIITWEAQATRASLLLLVGRLEQLEHGKLD
jgi:hypothetical protein